MRSKKREREFESGNRAIKRSVGEALRERWKYSLSHFLKVLYWYDDVDDPQFPQSSPRPAASCVVWYLSPIAALYTGLFVLNSLSCLCLSQCASFVFALCAMSVSVLFATCCRCTKKTHVHVHEQMQAFSSVKCVCVCLSVPVCAWERAGGLCDSLPIGQGKED